MSRSKPIAIPKEFPLTRKFTYLNTAGVGLIPKSTIDSTYALYLRYLSDIPYPDLFDEFGELVENSRGQFAKWIGAEKDQVSFQPSSSTALNFVNTMVDPKPGDNVVVDDLGFPSGTFPIIASQKKGVELRWVKADRDGLIRVEDYEKVLDRNTKLVIVSLVSWVNGLRAEVEEITRMAHERGAVCMVDSTHGTGYLEIDVKSWKVDFLVTSNYKWLLSTHGAAEFYCARTEEFDPPHLGWHSTPGGDRGLYADKLELVNSARRFEAGNPDYISIYTLVQSLEVLSRFGRKRINAQTLKLSSMVNDGLRKLGLSVLSPPDEKHLSGITFAHGKITGQELSNKLRKKNVIVTPRFYHEHSGIRISPYFYNDEEDVDRLLEDMKEII